jgi:predicted Zn-dependent protease
MMKMVERGVILNNLWYIRPVDAKSGVWTGLTRDGVLYFEDGEIKHSVTNFRWNEILHDATKRIIALGKAVQVEHYAVLPTIMFDDFNFVDVTTF